MEWNTPYIIYRLNQEGETRIVCMPEDITKAKYWMQYIAEPLDVLCKTPAHPKHSKKNDFPEYYGHKDLRGKAAYQEDSWRKEWEKRGWDATFPTSQG